MSKQEKDDNWFKRHKILLSQHKIGLNIVAALVLLGAGTGLGMAIGGSRSATTTGNTSTVANTAHKSAPCKPGDTKTLGNAGYVVGVDIAPGNYTVQDAFPATQKNVLWTNVDIYKSQSDYKGQDDGNAENGFDPAPGKVVHTMLKDGEYVSVWADDALFTCQQL